MSSFVHSIFCQFNEKMKIPHAIVDRKFEKDKFSIIVYCKEENINVNNEINSLNYLSSIISKRLIIYRLTLPRLFQLIKLIFQQTLSLLENSILIM